MIYQVYDKILNKVIVRDEMIFSKKKPRCISFDNKYFFNIESDRFDITETDNEEIIKLDENFLTNNYNIILWKHSYLHLKESVFRDFTIEELYKEVEKLVKVLNKIQYVTTVGSCCGHGNECLWVDMICHNFNSLIDIVNICTNKKFSDYFDIIILENENKIEKHKSIMIKLTTKQDIVGDVAYKYANELADYLEGYIENKTIK